MIDTRNDFEVSIGTFDGAIDPDTTSFGEFPAWWQANAHRFAGKRVGMFCTGGIRCEKATRSEEHTSELQSLTNLVCRLLLEKKKNKQTKINK